MTTDISRKHFICVLLLSVNVPSSGSEMWVFMFIIVFVLPEIQAKFYPTNVTDFSKCKIYYTRTGGSYLDFFEIADESHENDTLLDFHFSVLAPSDAHILLSPSSKLNKSDPAYEIVLGAGGNMFSDIRRAQKSAVKASVRLKNILSSLDIHSFWLHVSKDGLIEVGRQGEELAFLSWKDENLLPLKYFSFGTWPGVEAKWFYDCPREDNTTSDSKEVPKELTDLARLRMDLLTFYDPYVRPVLHPFDLTIVTMQLAVNYVSLHEYQSILNVKGQMKLAWTDEKMKWNPEDYGNIKSLHIVGRQIWQPDLMLYNSANSMGRDILGQSMMVATNDGSVEWTPPVDLNVWCDSSEMSNWPKDIYSCEVFLGFWADFNNLQLQFNDDNDDILGEQFHTEWNVLQVTAISNFGWNYSSPTTEYSAYNSDAPFLKLIFDIQRNSNIYGTIFYTPFLVISVCTLCSFWVSPFGPLKIILGCFQLIIIALMLVNLGSLIPVHPNTVPCLVSLYKIACYISISSLCCSVHVISISRPPHKFPVPRLIWKIVTSYPVQTILLLPKVKMSEEYGKLDEVSVTNNDESIENSWILVGTAVDRVGFICYFILITYIISTSYTLTT